MKKIFTLLLISMISMITACGLNDTSQSSSGVKDPVVDLSSLHLGADFTIDTLKGIPFKNDPNSLDYHIDKIEPTNQDEEAIALSLKNAIIEKYTANNSSNYNLGNHNIVGDIEASKMVVITFPIQLFNRNNSNENISGTYSFTIKFNSANTPAVLDFHLGDDFTIASLGDDKFNSNENGLQYEVSNVGMKQVGPSDLIKELESEIKKVHSLNTDVQYTLIHEKTTSNDENATSKYKIELVEMDNSSNKEVGTYAFNIYFRDPHPPLELDFYLGSKLSIPALSNINFVNDSGDTLTYNLNDVNRENTTNKDLIAGELAKIINAKLGSNTQISHILGNAIIMDKIDSDNTFTVTFPITLTEIANTTNTKNDNYIFNITFSEEVIPIPPVELTFDLGDNVKIAGNCFKPFTKDSNLIYTISNVDPMCQDLDTLSSQLREVIDTAFSTNTLVDHKILSIKVESTALYAKIIIPMEISDAKDTNRKEAGTYQFNITYKEPNPPMVFEYNLGDNITIDSLDGAKFKTSVYPFSAYTVSGINSDGKNAEDITKQIYTAVYNELKKDRRIRFSLQTHSPTGSIGLNQQLIVTLRVDKFEIGSTSNNTHYKKYTFTINFKGAPIAWDGKSNEQPFLSPEGFYVINKAEELAWLGLQTSINNDVKLMDNINMGNKQFQSIAKFEGIFDGNNKEIQNIYIFNRGDTPSALIKTITDNTTIKNLTINGNIEGDSNVASFIAVAESNSTTPFTLIIDNSTAYITLRINSDLNANHHLGGLIATASSTTVDIINSSNKGSIINKLTSTSNTGNAMVGGVIGYYYGGKLNISNVENSGVIDSTSASNSRVGGLIGSSSDGTITIDNSTNTAIITNTNSNAAINSRPVHTGGIIGYHLSGELNIINSNNTARINGRGKTGYTGGIVGGKEIGTIKLSSVFNKGLIHNVTTNDGYAGGLIGYQNKSALVIENSYNTGEVTNRIFNMDNNSYSGGLIGYSVVGTDKTNSTTVKNSFSYATIYAKREPLARSGNSKAGVITGSWYGPFNSETNYWYTENITANYTNRFSDKLTADQFTSKGSFHEWDFDNIWTLSVTGKKHPTLINNPE